MIQTNRLSSEVRRHESRCHHPSRAAGNRAAFRALADGRLQRIGGRAKNRFKNAFAQIDVQLKRRYDLIPNLVEAVKGYMSHERETLEAVIKARNSAMAAEQKAARQPRRPGGHEGAYQAEAQLGGALGRLFALAEAYPDLKANQNMLALQEELTSTENKVGFARQAFNDAATDVQHPARGLPGRHGGRHVRLQEAALLETGRDRARSAQGVVPVARNRRAALRFQAPKQL